MATMTGRGQISLSGSPIGTWVTNFKVRLSRYHTSLCYGTKLPTKPVVNNSRQLISWERKCSGPSCLSNSSTMASECTLVPFEAWIPSERVEENVRADFSMGRSYKGNKAWFDGFGLQLWPNYSLATTQLPFLILMGESHSLPGPISELSLVLLSNSLTQHLVSCWNLTL